MTDSGAKAQPSTTGPGRDGTLNRITEQVKFGHRAWMERLRTMQEIEAAFAKGLMATRDPNEAIKICNRWIAKRLERLAADSKDFTGFWMDLVMTAAGGLRVPGAAPTNGKEP